MSLPIVFSKAFYTAVAEYAQEFKTTRARFILKAIHHYAEFLRKKSSPMAEAIPSEEVVKAYREAQSEVSRNWWAKLTPKEKAERARTASEARWGPMKKK